MGLKFIDFKKSGQAKKCDKTAWNWLWIQIELNSKGFWSFKKTKFFL